VSNCQLRIFRFLVKPCSPSSTQRLANVVLELAIGACVGLQLVHERRVANLTPVPAPIVRICPWFSPQSLGFKVPASKWRPIACRLHDFHSKWGIVKFHNQQLLCQTFGDPGTHKCHIFIYFVEFQINNDRVMQTSGRSPVSNIRAWRRRPSVSFHWSITARGGASALACRHC
jgi:hypothetical protein